MFPLKRLFTACLMFTTWCLVCQAKSGCPKTCNCMKPLHCPPGVHPTLDLCGCSCKVCSRQLNENCSKLHPCDLTKGLHCDFGAEPTASQGICRAQFEGRSCFLNGTVYQNGETFQPSCNMHCSCLDGTVSCIPTCPLQIPLLGSNCRNPRLVKVPGKCCKEWQCQTAESNRIEDLSPQGHKKVTQRKETAQWNSNQNSIDRFGKQKLVAKASISNVIPALGEDWRNPGCPVTKSDWSECSKTCGLGISYRISTDNPSCQPRKEKRLCQIRPCGQRSDSSILSSKTQGRCTKVIKEEAPSSLVYENCISLRMHRPKYCGSCTNGSSCSPSRSRTVRIKFLCEGGAVITENMMWIQKCRCEGQDDHQQEEWNSLVPNAGQEKKKNAMKDRKRKRGWKTKAL